MNLDFFEVNPQYIDCLSQHFEHLFHNKKAGQSNERKYIGIVLAVRNFEYFVPLSSFKKKHSKMLESVDFKKLKRYAVLNLNTMIPVPGSQYERFIISNVKNSAYKDILLREYRIIKSRQDEIKRDALTVYNHKIKYGNSTKLAKRCLDFQLLEKYCQSYTGRA